MGFYAFILATIIPTLGVMLHCVVNILQGKGLETYDLVIMDHPVLTNLGVSYIEVFIGDFIALIALMASVGARYYFYRDERNFIQKYKIKGKTGFSKDFNSSKVDDIGEFLGDDD